MIGVIFNPSETRVVEELFQLFKTPWEPHRSGETYDVVLICNTTAPAVDAKLVLVYGTQHSGAQNRCSDATAVFRGTHFPLYDEVVTFKPGNGRAVCNTTDGGILAVETPDGSQRVVRVGYDLFKEISFLLTTGQPVANANIPTLDLHIAMLRSWILDAGLPLVEVSPTPAGRDFAVCLTHDIDFVGIRRHKFDHTMFGFLYRSLVAAPRNYFRGRIKWSQLKETWGAVLKLPFVYLGWAKDFWMPFEWYLEVEKGLGATYFLIPFKHRCGDKVAASHASRRASAYGVSDIPEWTSRLKSSKCEIGVHGIDAWHSVESGREELREVAAAAGTSELGTRIHWLLRDSGTCRVLEEAGYTYDSTSGYNEVPGYFAGTTQVFRPLNTQKLLELPMHLQDGALFFSNRLGLSDAEAGERCDALIRNAQKLGGVLTVIWHDRSHGPERFWGDFYVRLVAKLKNLNAWFGAAGEVVSWFRQRRSVSFDRIRVTDGVSRIRVCGMGEAVYPPLNVRVYRPAHTPGAQPKVLNFSWDGKVNLEIETGDEAVPVVAEEAVAASRVA